MNDFSQIMSLSFGVSSFVVAMEGNVSHKTKDGFLIKKSGSSLKNLTKDDVVACKLDGTPIDKNNKPSMEVDFHSWFYKNTEFKFIAHTHPTNTLKILCRSDLIDSFANKRLFPDQVIFNGKKSCLIEYANPGENLKKSIEQGVLEFKLKEGQDPKLILLQNHGIIALGKTINECIYITEICEKSAELFFSIANKFDNINFLSDVEIDALIKDKNEIFRINSIKNEI